VKNSLLSVVRTHPASWWMLGLAFAIAASIAVSPVTLLALSTLSMLFVLTFRDQSPWSRSVVFYIRLAGIVIAIRVLFRMIFNLEASPANPLIVLPELNLDLGNQISLHLLGPISSASLLAALTDGLRLAAIILAIGMANSLANPMKLLKSTPGALYEIATAISIAINLAPQLIASLNRVRRARGLRGQSKGIKSLPGLVIPVLEDTIDQSMTLAASMSARGFGRKGSQSKGRLQLTRFIGLTGLVLIAVGVFLLILNPTNQVLDLAVTISGLLSTVIYIKMSALGSLRTRYSVQKFRSGDYLLYAFAAAILLLSFSGVLTF
jgi:energy-coupling factor transport system permease protein